MVLKYGVEVDNYAIESIFKKITNQIYKLLPMREENGDWKNLREWIECLENKQKHLRVFCLN